MFDEGSNMAIKTKSDIEVEALQAILVAQGESVSYEEAAELGVELVGFFEALGEENEQEDSHAR
jgi:hypothetical protein